MINHIKIICDKELLILSKKRVFAFVFAVVSVVLSLFVLICINRILVRAKVEGNMDYDELLFLHKRIWDIIYGICIVFSIFLASMSINIDKKRLALDHMLATHISREDIVLGKFVSYIISTMSLSFLCMPICMLPTFFGGISYVRMIFLLILLFFSMLSFTSFVLMLSSVIYQENISLFISIICGALYMVCIFYFRDIVIDNRNFYIIVISTMVVMSILCLLISIRSKVFD